MSDSVRVTNIDSTPTGWISRIFAAIIISSGIGGGAATVASAISDHADAVREQTRAIERVAPRTP